MPTTIHSTAIVEDGARIGADCEIHAYAIVRRWATLGDRVVVHPFSVIGGDPQDLKFDGVSPSYVRVGAGTRIRESVTINRATHAECATTVGENCLLMACSHVAHDCSVGNGVVIANAALLAGHVSVGDHAILGGSSAFHQFIRVGERAMVSGVSRLTADVPPFSLVAERNEMIGLNLVGLKRAGLSRESVRDLKDAFRAVYGGNGNLREAAAEAVAEGLCSTPEARRFLEFFATGDRGFCRPRQSGDYEESMLG
jgi:UDP-N-acetylglucosamine acyltransferase